MTCTSWQQQLKTEAQAIVTMNTKDFPSSICHKEDVEAISPDDFLIHQWDFDSERVRSIIYGQVGALRTPTMGIANVVVSLAEHAPRFARRLTKAITHDLEDLIEYYRASLENGEATDIPKRLASLVEVARDLDTNH